MNADTAASATRPSTAADTRARILAAASELFYSHGIRATSADRVIEQVGLTKVTFYRHFRTKSDLVVAYLQAQADAERGWIQNLRRTGDPAGSLRAIAAGLGAASCSPGFRGCAFINAAAEFARDDDPVRLAVDAHRRWMLGELASIAAEAKVGDAEAAARQLMMLRDGAMVSGYLDGPAAVAASLEAAFLSIVGVAAPA